MFDHLNVVAASVFVFFFALVTVLGFVAARWKSGDLNSYHRMGSRRPPLRQMGDMVSAWRRSLYGLHGDRDPGGRLRHRRVGFFAVPYTIIIYPFLYLTLPRLWAVSRKHGYLTASDFVLGRYGDRWLELAVALTGIFATMPYIALQLVGLEKVIGALGILGRRMAAAPAHHHRLRRPRSLHLQSGLRAPALIAFVKER